MRVVVTGTQNIQRSTSATPGPFRVKELKDTISTLREENVQLSIVKDQFERVLQTIYKNSICCVCLDVLHDPLLLLCPKQCLQNMCRDCFMKTDERCPTCKDLVVTSISCGYTINSLLSCVPRECDDCHCMIYPTDRHTTLQQCKAHHDVCLEAELECCNKTHGCSLKYKRIGKLAHLKERCSHIRCTRFIGCYDGRSFGCKFRGNSTDVAEHEKTCVLEQDTHFLYNELLKYTKHDEPQTPTPGDHVEKCKNVERIIILLQNEHHAHY